MTSQQKQAALVAIQRGESMTAVARRLKIPRTTLREALAASAPAVAEGVLDCPVPKLKRRLAVSPPRHIDKKSGTTTALIYGDSHFPFQDDATLSIIHAVANEIKPDVIVHMGDLLDCYNLSRFDKDPLRKTSVQQEIDLAREHLAQMRMASPASKIVFLEGNHCDRLRRTLWSMKGEAAALNQITSFQRAMTWPALLGLDELGIQFHPYNGTLAIPEMPKFLLKHGSIVRAYSGATARGEMESYNRSGSSGHTHRLGEYFRTDYNGGHVWIETGCTCSIKPEYVSDPNWQNGFVVLSFDMKTGAVGAELVHVIKGRAVWCGKVYQA